MSLDHHVRATGSPGVGSVNADGGDDVAAVSRPRRRRRGVLVGLGVLVVLVSAAVVAVARGDGGGGTSGEGAGSTTTVPVEVRDLVLSDELEGELSFGEADPVTAGRDGVVTGVTPLRTTVGQGGVLFHLGLQPTVLLRGDVPAFRDLSVDADPGADVTQLEQALVALGYGGGVTVDAQFTAATAAAVTRWERALGRSAPDGVVTLGDVLFAHTDLRIASVTAEPGTQVQSGAEVVQATGTTKTVTLELTAAEAGNLEAGSPVGITLPDETETTGTISDVATEPTPASSDSSSDSEGPGSDDSDSSDDSDGTYPVTITLDDPAAADAVDSGAVAVTVERSRVEDATAVPVTALLARSGGGYAVQVVDDAEPRGYRTVAVEVGAIAGEWAEVSGDGIEAGVEVVVPA